MSVQLIIYPQKYKGFSSTIFNLPVEMLANGNDFVNIGDYVSSYPAPYSTLSQQAVTALFPTIPNTWYGYFTVGGYGAPVYDPTSDRVVFFGQGSGMLQNLTNLTAGLVYNFELTVDLTGGLSYYPLTLDIFNEDVLDTSIVISPTSDVTTVQFTAPSDNFTMLALTNISATATDLVAVSNISIMEAPTEPSGDAAILGDGQVILDLYEEEDLPLTLSVEDFKNVAENVQSYSKAFNLPATKRNNKAFDSIFEITRDFKGIIFNPYQKTECILKQDGFLLFKGYLRLLDVTDKLGEISYNVNLYSEVIALADTLKDRAFRDLDFTELEHDYNKDNIKRSWNDSGNSITYINSSTSGFRNAYNTLRYPFVDWNHQILIGGSGSGTGNDSTDGNPEYTNLEQIFRPFINIKYLIDRIFEATDFTYESTFISNDDDFNKLYMDFNWGSDNSPVQSVSNSTNTYNSFNGYNSANFAGTSYTNLSLEVFVVAGFPIGSIPPNYDTTTNILTSTSLNETYNINYSYRITNTDSVTRTIECRYLKNSTEFDYSGIITLSAGASFVYQGNLNISLDTGDTLQAQFKASSAGVVQQTVLGSSSFSFGTNVIFILGVSSITTETLLQTLRGELGQWDFLKGLITMFNLVTLPDEDNPNNIIIEPYGNIFVNTGSGESLADRGIQHDWTDKIDVSQMKLEPLTDLNKKTIFKFVEDDDDYSFNQYKNLVGGHLYGSKEYNAGNAFNILEGTDEIVAEPFAATIVKPLMSQFPDFITPAIYARGSDATWEGFENSPRIMYNNGIKNTGASYYIPAQNGLDSENQTLFLQFSHLTDIPTIVDSPPTPDTRDFHFGECQLMTGVGDATPNNLFNLFWLPYYSQLYNPNTRIMTIKVNLTPSDINLFKFNDVVFLKNRTFRVNKIDYKPNDLATVEFILII